MNPITKTHALAIEDNHDFARIFGHLLRVMGCEIESASTAESGLLIAGSMRLDIIFCDIGLNGDMDGLAFARILRADPHLKHLPLIAVSAQAGQNNRDQAREAGFDKLLAKPIKFVEVAEVLGYYGAARA